MDHIFWINILTYFIFPSSLNPKIKFLAWAGAFVRISVHIGDCYQHNSKINYGRYTNHSILQLYHMQMLFEVFYEDWTNIFCIGVNKTLECIHWITCSFTLIHLDCTEYNEIKAHFQHSQVHITNWIWYEYQSYFD